MTRIVRIFRMEMAAHVSSVSPIAREENPVGYERYARASRSHGDAGSRCRNDGPIRVGCHVIQYTRSHRLACIGQGVRAAAAIFS